MGLITDHTFTATCFRVTYCLPLGPIGKRSSGVPSVSCECLDVSSVLSCCSEETAKEHVSLSET